MQYRVNTIGTESHNWGFVHYINNNSEFYVMDLVKTGI